jgi:hypothetical protein
MTDGTVSPPLRDATKETDKPGETSSTPPASDNKHDRELPGKQYEIRFLSPRYRRSAERQAGEPVLTDAEAEKRDQANAKRYGVSLDEARCTIFEPSERMLKYVGHGNNNNLQPRMNVNTLTAAYNKPVQPRTYAQAKAKTDAMLAAIAAGQPTHYVPRFSARDMRRDMPPQRDLTAMFAMVASLADSQKATVDDQSLA